MKLAELRLFSILLAMTLFIPIGLAAAPDGNITLIEGDPVGQAGKYYSEGRDANLLITFTVIDLDQDDINFSVWWDTSSAGKTNQLLTDFNLSANTLADGGTTHPARCDSNDSSTTMTCTYDFNISKNLLFDQNYFLTIDINSSAAGVEATDTNSFALSFVVDNNVPTAGPFIPTNPNLTTTNKRVQFDVNDSLAGISAVSVTMAGNPSSDFGFPGKCTQFDTNYHCDYTEGLMGSGTRVLEITITDRSGNSDTNSISYSRNVLTGSGIETLITIPELIIAAGLLLVIVAVGIGAVALTGSVLIGIIITAIAVTILLVVFGTFVNL